MVDLNSICYIIMKLQRFIEKFRKDKGGMHSPERSAVFRTSESIGTLNSRDESATDRSFAIKEIPIHLSADKHQTTQEVDHLRDLCESDRPAFSKPTVGDSLKPIEEFSSDNDDLLVATFSRAAKPNFSFRQPGLEEGNLYEEAPSQQITEMEGRQKMQWLLGHEEKQFLALFQVLTERVRKLEEENLLLEEGWLEEEKMLLRYEKGCGKLEEQIGVLRERVTNTIQENIETENRIKQILLKQEMHKYRYFTKEQSRQLGLMGSPSLQKSIF